MKTVYLIGGTMGVGKTAVSRALQRKLEHSVFLDGDWCWDASPFCVTDETKAMVQNNICFLLNSFIHCSAYDNIIFCWVMHEQGIIDSLASGIDISGCKLRKISLLCSESTLRERLGGDVAAGVRTDDVIERSVLRLPCYSILSTEKIVTDNKSIEEIADEITEMKV